MREPARHADALTEADIRNLHRLLMFRSRSGSGIAGRYADQGRYILTETGRHAFPSPAEIPALIHDLVFWLRAETAKLQTAITAHRRLVDIHPFNDSNGRTARFLMNLLLLRAGYPPVSIGPQDRPASIDALQRAQAGQGSNAFERLLFERLDVTLDEYVGALRQAIPPPVG